MMSPERSNSPQNDQVATPKMSVPASPVAGTPVREAQSPISLLLTVAQSQKNGDDDLTSLSWLHDRDLLKGMNLVNPSPSNSLNSTPIKFLNNNNNNNNNHIFTDQSPTSDYVDDSSISAAESSSSSVHSPISNTSYTTTNSGGVQRKHPHNVPYDPLVHTANKPPYSFSCLIFMAIEDSEQKALPVKEIYSWILDHFPYFRTAPTGWKNSVRHNLSLNKCFQKIEKAPNLGKGSLWTVDEQYKPNLLQALTRSPFHPCSTLDPTSYFSKSRSAPPTPTNSYVSSSTGSRLPNPELFPYLSRTLAATEIKEEPRLPDGTSDDSLDAVDAATVMLSLKNGPRYRQRKERANFNVWQVITTSPSQDHTYSATAGNMLQCDEAFESDEERFPKTSVCRKINFEDDEERKIKEGAETLLNLAGVLTRKRSNSGEYEDSFGKPKVTKQHRIDGEEEYDKPTQFRPRLLRVKKKNPAGKQKVCNNNNEDEWVKHRRELEIGQPR